MGKTVGARVLELYTDRDGFSIADKMTIQKEYGLTPNSGDLISRIIGDGITEDHELNSLKIEFGPDQTLAEFQDIAYYNQNAALSGWFKWFAALDTESISRDGEKLSAILSQNTTIQGERFKQATAVEFFNEQLAKAILSQDTAIQGFSFTKGTSLNFLGSSCLYPILPGNLKSAYLSQDTVIDQLTYKSGTEVLFGDEGVIGGVLSQDSIVNGVPCKGGVEIQFGLTKDLRKFTLSQDASLWGTLFKAGTKFDKRTDLRPQRAYEWILVLPEDTLIQGIPCQKGDNTHLHLNGRVSFTRLSQDMTFQGIPFKKGAWVEFYPEGQLEWFALSQDQIIQGISFKKGSWVKLEPDGKLVHVQTDDETLIQGIPCKGGSANNLIEFHSNGRIERASLAREATIQGISLKGESHIYFNREGKLEKFYSSEATHVDGISCMEGYVAIHPNGKIKNAFLSKDTTIQGIHFKKGHYVEFHSNGKILGDSLSEDTFIMGRPFKKGDHVYNSENGLLISNKTESKGPIPERNSSGGCSIALGVGL